MSRKADSTQDKKSTYQFAIQLQNNKVKKVSILDLLILPSPDTNDHQVRIMIDGHDWLKDEYLGIDPHKFFKRTALETGGKAIVARCVCGEEGCGNITADIQVEENFVHWNTSRGQNFTFEKSAYLKMMTNAAEDHTWESPERTVERLVDEVLRGLTLENGMSFEWAFARNKKTEIMLSFSKGREHKIHYISWDGDNPESAQNAAIIFKNTL